VEGLQLAVDGDTALIRLVQAIQLAHQSALAGTHFRRAGHALPRADIEQTLEFASTPGKRLTISHISTCWMRWTLAVGWMMAWSPDYVNNNFRFYNLSKYPGEFAF